MAAMTSYWIYVIALTVYIEVISCDCDARCTGINCTSGIDDKRHCFAWCKDISCWAGCIGLNCSATCIGVHCQSGCDGEGCSSSCIGHLCKSSCTGINCKQYNTLWSPIDLPPLNGK